MAKMNKKYVKIYSNNVFVVSQQVQFIMGSRLRFSILYTCMETDFDVY